MNYQIKQCKFFKLGLLVSLLAILVWSCENDEVLEDVNLEQHTFKTVSKAQAQNVFNSFQKKREGFIRNSPKSNHSFLEIVPNWNSFKEESLGFTDALLSTTEIKTNALTTLSSRLIFLEVDDRLLRVIESKQAVRQIDNKVVDGYVYFHNLDGKFITGYKVENSIVTKQLIKKANVSKASFLSLISFYTAECEEDLIPNSNFCNDTLDEITITTTTGNVNTEASVYYYSFGGGFSDGVYDPYGDSDWSNGGGGLAGDFDNEEEEEQIINELTGKADCVYQKMVDNKNNINWILKNFKDGNTPSQFNLKFVMSTTLSNTTNASTSKNGNMFTIKINANTLSDRTSLGLARTIIHEGIHARLREFLHRKGGTLSKEDFPGVYEYFRTYGKNWDHQQMADYYRSTIAKGLMQFDNGQHSDQFYDDMAWEGLANIVDANNKPDQIYTEAWKKLTVEEQNRIKSAIANEKENGNKTCEK